MPLRGGVNPATEARQAAAAVARVRARLARRPNPLPRLRRLLRNYIEAEGQVDDRRTLAALTMFVEQNSCELADALDDLGIKED